LASWGGTGLGIPKTWESNWANIWGKRQWGLEEKGRVNDTFSNKTEMRKGILDDTGSHLIGEKKKTKGSEREVLNDGGEGKDAVITSKLLRK